MRVAVFGASGVLGRHVIPRLVERGDTVIAIRHRRPAAPGCSVRRADVLEAASIAPAIEGCEAVLHLATAIPPPGRLADWSRNDRIRHDGAANLIAACRTLGVMRYVQQSIAMLCSGAGNDWVDERSPTQPNRITRSAADMEARVIDSGLDFRIVRGGLFYGGGSGTETRWYGAARRGSLQLPGDGSDYLSLIHVSDMAEVVVRALHADAQELLVNAVDDCPVTYRELFGYIAANQRAQPPRCGAPPMLPSFRVRNALARRVLGWRPHYASWRSGLADGNALDSRRPDFSEEV